MIVKCLPQEHNTMTPARARTRTFRSGVQRALVDKEPPRGIDPGGGGRESYFPYILLNEIQTMFSQLAKQSHWKLSADCSIAHEHIRPVDLPVNTFSNGN